MGRDMVSRFGLTVYHGMGRIVSENGRDETLVIAENAFFVSEMCPICLIWDRSSYGMAGFHGTHRSHREATPKAR